MRIKEIGFALGVFAFFITFLSNLDAKTIVVPDDFSEIQDAAAAAKSGDTIHVKGKHEFFAPLGGGFLFILKEGVSLAGDIDRPAEIYHNAGCISTFVYGGECKTADGIQAMGNNRIENITIRAEGTAIEMVNKNKQLRIIDSVIDSSNPQWETGSKIESNKLLLKGNTFIGRDQISGAGLIKNNIFTRVSALFDPVESGVALEGDLRVINNVFYIEDGNSIVNAVTIKPAGTMLFVNNIAWGNGPSNKFWGSSHDLIIEDNSGQVPSTLMMGFNDFPFHSLGLSASKISINNWGGDIAADPLFLDPANLDFHLMMGSACIDAGLPSIEDSDGSNSDMGAFGGI